MKIIEVRRHAMRNKPGDHLSQAGVDLARRVGMEIAMVDRVITSDLPRAIETAIAMGFAPDITDGRLASMGDEVSAEIEWDAGFAAFAATIARDGATARFARDQHDLWIALAAELPEHGHALVITHGGFIEAVAGLMPDRLPSSSDDRACGYCEGARFTIENGALRDIELLRLPSI
jgi:broad specificity phosphatase PhoE